MITLDAKLLVLKKKTAALSLLRRFEVEYETFLAGRNSDSLRLARDLLLATLDALEDASTDSICVVEELPRLATQALGGDWQTLYPLVCDSYADIRRFCQDAGMPIAAPPANFLENMQRVVALSSPGEVERLRPATLAFGLPIPGFPSLPEPCCAASVSPSPSGDSPIDDAGLVSHPERTMNSEADAPIKVLTTYSWDTKEHEESVQRLVVSLREDGIDCDLDKFDPVKAEGLPRWMEGKIKGAKFVICVCTESYCRRFEGREEPGRGLGANFEGKVITQAIYEAGGKNEKFIPVVFTPSDSKHIPEALKGAIYYTLSAQEGYDDLFRRLTGQPADVPPPVGTLRKLPQREGQRLFAPAGSTAVAAPEAPPTAPIAEIQRIGAESDFTADHTGVLRAKWRLSSSELPVDGWLDVRVRLEVIDANYNLVDAGDWSSARGYTGRWETQRLQAPAVPSRGGLLMFANVESCDPRYPRAFQPRQFTTRIY